MKSLKKCNKCNELKPLSQFYFHRWKRLGGRGYYDNPCKECGRPEKQQREKKNYRIRMERKAGRPMPSGCEICKKEGSLHFDHDHATGQFRGWLCIKCNHLIGDAKEDCITLLKAVQYLQGLRA